MWLYLLVSSALKGQSRHQDAERNGQVAVQFLTEPESLDESSDPLGRGSERVPDAVTSKGEPGELLLMKEVLQ